MTYEDEIVAAALQGLRQGGMDTLFNVESLRPLLSVLYKAGYFEAQRNAKGFTGLDD